MVEVVGFGLRVTVQSVALDKWVILEEDGLTIQSGQPTWLVSRWIPHPSVPRSWPSCYELCQGPCPGPHWERRPRS